MDNATNPPTILLVGDTTEIRRELPHLKKAYTDAGIHTQVVRCPDHRIPSWMAKNSLRVLEFHLKSRLDYEHMAVKAAETYIQSVPTLLLCNAWAGLHVATGEPEWKSLACKHGIHHYSMLEGYSKILYFGGMPDASRWFWGGLSNFDFYRREAGSAFKLTQPRQRYVVATSVLGSIQDQCVVMQEETLLRTSGCCVQRRLRNNEYLHFVVDSGVRHSISAVEYEHKTRGEKQTRKRLTYVLLRGNVLKLETYVEPQMSFGILECPIGLELPSNLPVIGLA